MTHETTHYPDSGVIVASTVDLEDITPRWGLLLAFGILTILAGTAAILLPVVAAFTVELLVGGLLIFAGLLKALQAYQLRSREGTLWAVLESAAALATGLFLVTFPLWGVLSLAFAVGIYFIITGVAKSVFALQLRPMPCCGWLTLSGILSLVLGVLVLAALPGAAPWVIGLLFGIDLIFGGWWLTALALESRRQLKA